MRLFVCNAAVPVLSARASGFSGGSPPVSTRNPAFAAFSAESCPLIIREDRLRGTGTLIAAQKRVSVPVADASLPATVGC